MQSDQSIEITDLIKNYEPRVGSVPVFGMILYTDSHPIIKKMLRDDDYWAALDEISGSKWPVFSIRAKAGSYKHSEHQYFKRFYMTPIWKEPSENKKLLDWLALESTEQLPLLVVFTFNDGEEVDRTVVKLDDENPDIAFNRLREVFSVIKHSIDNIPVEDLNSGLEVLSAIRYALDKIGRRERLKEGYRLIKEIRDWLPL